MINPNNLAKNIFSQILLVKGMLLNQIHGKSDERSKEFF